MAESTRRLQCQYCMAIFGREEHLSRHLLRHSESRPFQCLTCGRSFQRRDTLKRHVSTHGPEAVQSYASWASTASHRTRACRQCARVKKRCMGSRPCTRCLNKALPCEPGREKSEHIRSGFEPSADVARLPEGDIVVEQSSTAVRTPDASASSLMSRDKTVINIHDAQGTSASDVPDFTIPDADIANMMNAPQLDFVDPQYLGSSAWNFPFFFASSPQPLASVLPGDFDASHALPSLANDNAGLAPTMEAAQHHGFDEPTQFQRLGDDNEDDDDLDALAAEDFGHPCRLSTESFQRLQHFLEEKRKPDQPSGRPCQGVPPISAVNAFLQLYFEHFAPQFPFIHLPTFEPDNVTELLVIAVANIGCHYSRSRHRRLYRGVFMEVLGNSIKQQIPHNPNSNNLELLQCVMLYNMSMMCGGHMNEVLKLQFERNTLVTLFRWSRRPMNRNIQRHSIANAADIEGLWRSWVNAETEKRVLYSVWMLECCNRLFFEDHPLLSLSEINLALPSKDELWYAANAHNWHPLYLRDSKRHTSLSALFLGPRPTAGELEDLGGFSRTIALITFSIEERQVLESSQCWISPASLSGPEQSYRTQLLRDRDSDLRLFAFDSPFQLTGNSHEARGRRYFHLISILRDVPLRRLYALCGWRSSDSETDTAETLLSAWMRDNIERARKCALHAGVLFGEARTQTHKMSFDPLFLLVPILYLWAYQKLSPDKSFSAGSKPVLRIDCGIDEAVANSWIHGENDYAVHITGAGRLTGRDSAGRLLKELRRVLYLSTTWIDFHVGVAKGIEQMIKGEKPLEPACEV